jgi:hypothetical protein
MQLKFLGQMLIAIIKVMDIKGQKMNKTYNSEDMNLSEKDLKIKLVDNLVSGPPTFESFFEAAVDYADFHSKIKEPEEIVNKKISPEVSEHLTTLAISEFKLLTCHFRYFAYMDKRVRELALSDAIKTFVIFASWIFMIAYQLLSK